jgi:hypothetical protein
MNDKEGRNFTPSLTLVQNISVEPTHKEVQFHVVLVEFKLVLRLNETMEALEWCQKKAFTFST